MNPPEPELRIAVLGFPSDRGMGGGLMLLSRLGPALRARKGRILWIDETYREDAERLAQWSADGVELSALNQSRTHWQKWLDRCRGRVHPVERDLARFRPNLLIVASGTDKWYANDQWRLKKQLADRWLSRGAVLVMMHQLSEKGTKAGPGEEEQAWLAWQKSASWHQFVSEATRRETEENFGQPLRGEIIRNNYNVPYDDPPPWPVAPALKLAFVGRFDLQQKGLDLLLAALADPSWRRLSDWELNFFGGDARDGLAAAIAAAGLSAHVRLMGRTSDIRGIWVQHHALVMPSRAEGLSLALCEAMLCDRPAIASAVGGTRELLEDGSTGWETRLEPADLVRQLHRAREAFLSGTMEAMGRNAGARARAVFPAHPEERYLDQLEAVLASSRSVTGGRNRL